MSLWRTLLVSLWLASPSTVRADDAGYEAHRARGIELAAEARHREAVFELTTASRILPSPDLLLLIARSQRSLGHGVAALAYYRRFLERGDPNESEKAEATAEIERLNRLVADEPDPDAPVTLASGLRLRPGEELVAVRYERRISRGLFFTGFGLALGGYLPALIGGTAVAGFDRSAERGRGLTLLIPVAGPVVSGIVAKDGVWAASWILTSGVLQSVGLALMIAGGIRTHEVPVVVSATANPGGGGVLVSGRF